MKRAAFAVLPHPLLTAVLIIVWCLLNSSLTMGTIVMGTILGVLIPQATAAYWPGSPTNVRPIKAVIYVVIVVWDIVVANVQMAWIVLTKRNAAMRSTWVVIPLDLRTPEAITILAGTITLTPGTVSADLSAEGHSLLVHALDAPDPEAVRDEIKHRYERRLKEIFE